MNLRKKTAVLATVFLAVVGGLTYCVVLPTVQDIKKIKKEIETQRLDLENKYHKGKNLRKLTKNLKKIEPEMDKLNQVFINRNRALEFITTLEEIAAKNSVMQKINLPAFQEVKGGQQQYKKIPLQALATGDFIGQLKYLTGLESLNYYINIKTLEFSTSDGAVNLLINADTFWE